MTVGELIEYLEKLDKDMEVIATDTNYPSQPLTEEELILMDGKLHIC